MACFTYNPSSSIKLQGVYNSENWLPPLTSPTLARRRPSTIADMMVGIEPGGYSGYSESGTISYQLSPQPGPPSLSLSVPVLCCGCRLPGSGSAASFLFVGSEQSFGPFRQLRLVPAREDTEGQDQTLSVPVSQEGSFLISRGGAVEQ